MNNHTKGTVLSLLLCLTVWVGAAHAQSTVEGGAPGTSTPVPPQALYVSSLYKNLLLRKPDPGGYSYWVDVAPALTCSQIATYFVNSTEFHNRLVADDQFVTMLYRALLNRNPEPGGFVGWLGVLSRGVPREKVVNAFLAAPEFNARCKDIWGYPAGAGAHSSVLPLLSIGTVPGAPGNPPILIAPAPAPIGL